MEVLPEEGPYLLGECTRELHGEAMEGRTSKRLGKAGRAGVVQGKAQSSNRHAQGGPMMQEERLECHWCEGDHWPWECPTKERLEEARRKEVCYVCDRLHRTRDCPKRFERAQRKEVCFLCDGLHRTRDCPRRFERAQCKMDAHNNDECPEEARWLRKYGIVKDGRVRRGTKEPSQEGYVAADSASDGSAQGCIEEPLEGTVCDEGEAILEGEAMDRMSTLEAETENMAPICGEEAIGEEATGEEAMSDEKTMGMMELMDEQAGEPTKDLLGERAVRGEPYILPLEDAWESRRAKVTKRHDKRGRPSYASRARAKRYKDATKKTSTNARRATWELLVYEGGTLTEYLIKWKGFPDEQTKRLSATRASQELGEGGCHAPHVLDAMQALRVRQRGDE